MNRYNVTTQRFSNERLKLKSRQIPRKFLIDANMITFSNGIDVIDCDFSLQTITSRVAFQ